MNGITGRYAPRNETDLILVTTIWAVFKRRAGAAIFDPAVYNGHRETDIGMTRLFGGFDNKFYEGYQDVYPLQKGWQQRLPYTQLYPLLVHAVLFGGHYIASVQQILRKAE